MSISSIKDFLAKKKYELFFLAFLSIAFLVLRIPTNMDEFLAFHAYSCTNESQSLNFGNFSCPGIETNLGFLKYYRSYDYIGISSSIVIGIFNLFFPAQLSYYIFGFLSLIIIIKGIQKSFEIENRSLFLFIISPPLLYPIIHDTGPVRLSLIAFSWGPYLLKRVSEATDWLRTCIYTMLTVFLFLIAIEDKPFFLFLIPSIYLLSGKGFSSLKSIKKIIVIAITVFLSTLYLNFAKTGELSYLRILEMNRSNLGIRRGLIGGVLYAISPPYQFNRIYENDWLIYKNFNDIRSDFLYFTLVLISSFLFLLILLTSRRKKANKEIFYLLSVYLILIVSISASGGWANHHFIYSNIVLFIIISKHLSIDTKLLVKLTIFSIICMLSLNNLTTQSDVSREIDILTNRAIMNSKNGDVIAFLDWGGYSKYSYLNLRGISIISPQSYSQIKDFVVRKEINTTYILCQYCDSIDSLPVKDYQLSSIKKLKYWKLYLLKRNLDFGSNGHK